MKPKDFFSKVLAFVRKVWDKLVSYVLSVPVDKRLHFFAGVIFAAFTAITLDMKFCWWPVVFLAFGKELFDQWTGGEFDGKDFLATCLGGLVPQLLVVLRMWWF